MQLMCTVILYYYYYTPDISVSFHLPVSLPQLISGKLPSALMVFCQAVYLYYNTYIPSDGVEMLASTAGPVDPADLAMTMMR